MVSVIISRGGGCFCNSSSGGGFSSVVRDSHCNRSCKGGNYKGNKKILLSLS